MMIESDPEMKVTGEAANGQEAVELCESHLFDIVILDIRMPVMDGLEAARRIIARRPDQKVLILTTFNDDGYALEGGLSIEDHVAAKVVPRLLRGSRAVPSAEPDPSLTPRELDIVRGVGEGRSNKEIAEELGLSVGTVKNHISIILDKLDLRDRTQLAIYAIRHDIV